MRVDDNIITKTNLIMYCNVFFFFVWCPCMAINVVSVQHNGGFLPGIVLLPQCYYHRGTCLNPMIPPKRFNIFPPLTEGCSEGLDAFRFFLKQPISPCVGCSEGLDPFRFFSKLLVWIRRGPGRDDPVQRTTSRAGVVFYIPADAQSYAIKMQS